MCSNFVVILSGVEMVDLAPTSPPIRLSVRPGNACGHTASNHVGVWTTKRGDYQVITRLSGCHQILASGTSYVWPPGFINVDDELTCPRRHRPQVQLSRIPIRRGVAAA